MISSKTKIGLLVAGHVVAGLLLGSIVYLKVDTGADLRPLMIALDALVFAEAGLLGIWVALGTARPLRWVPVVLAITAYLGAVLVTAYHSWQTDTIAKHLLLEIALPTFSLLFILSVMRHGQRRLRLTHSAVWSTTCAGLQFSIRHVLLATAVVAVVLGMGRGISTFADMVGKGAFLAEARLELFVATLSPCLIVVDLATLWAALGTGRPPPRLAVVLPMAFVVGTIPIYYLGNEDSSSFVVWSVIFGLQAIITAASLLVVRSCGWRLVSGGGTTNGQPIQIGR